MSYNGSGTFSINSAGQPTVAATLITATAHNALTADLATGLSTAITKDGQTTITANLPMGGFKHTGLGAGSAAGNSVRYEQVLLLAGGNMTGGVNEARANITQHATTMDLFALAIPNILDGTGSAVTITAIVNAPQGGPTRTLYPVTGTVITNGATFAVDGAADYTTAAGDALEFEAVTTSTYKVHITKEDGTAVVGGSAASDTASGVIELAVQSEQETGTDVLRAVTPGRQQFHPSAAKAWVTYTSVTTTAILGTAYNITSLTDNGTGDTTVTIATDFSDANWCSIATPGGGANVRCAGIFERAAGTVRIITSNAGIPGVEDMDRVSFVGFGDQ